ncbi:MAG: response regulator [Acidobacteriota bacterium]
MERATGRTVLIVDDDSTVREVLAAMLRESGYRSLEAADGVSALEHCRTGGPDLILLDLVMPNQEGIETMRELKKAHPTAPVIAMSGHPGYLAPARALGAAATLEKPISAKALVQSVRQLIG